VFSRYPPSTKILTKIPTFTRAIPPQSGQPRPYTLIITKLEPNLFSAIAWAQEIWIAVALVKDDGYDVLRPLLTGVRQHYIIGINLPTTPSVLRTIRDHQHARPGTIEAQIAGDLPVFHPKVYIIKKGNRLQAIVGSANLTLPALRSNREMSYLITDQEECQALIEWFNDLYNQAFPLTNANLAEHESTYRPGGDGSGHEPSTNRRPHLTRPNPDEAYLNTVDLSGYFFGNADYLALRPSIEADHSPEANRERHAVYQKFLGLHDIIFPQFREYGISGLDHHVRPENIVSHYYHVEHYTSDRLDAMWLSYGKNHEEIRRYQRMHRDARIEGDTYRDPYTFVNHSRLQIRIDLRSLGIWILFAKNNAGDYDRDHFRQNMNNPTFRREFFDLLIALPEPYQIRVNEQIRPVSSFRDPDELHHFTNSDNRNEYFTIWRDYELTDPALLQTRLPITTLSEFQRLFPLYDKMRHHLVSI
jgi:HKD family nuclease